MTSLALEARGLRKVYTSSFGRRRLTALDGLDLAVHPGELFGLLGPNGAGKTTTVKILLGLTRATEGSASILGIPVSHPASRARVGYLPEGHRFPGYLTARQTLSIFGRMSDVAPAVLDRRIPELLARVKLTDWADQKVKKFSKGMTQRLGLAAALVHDPAVLLLDEPTDGVDPLGRREIRDLLREEASRGRAILLNSHLLSEIELTCDRVAVIRRGQVAAQGTVAELTGGGTPATSLGASALRYRLVASGMDEPLLAALRSAGGLAERVNGHVQLAARDLVHLNEMVDEVRRGGGVLSELTPMKATLEDVFIDLVKTEAPGGAIEMRDARRDAGKAAA